MLVIEHNLDVIKTADYVIDLGPEGGDRGGMLVAKGTPEAVAATVDSFTGGYLARVLVDARAHGAMAPDHKAQMVAFERENLAALDDLAHGERLPVEA